ncbi:ASCH domain-containing protein [Haloferacaceae archaeon DSL9]
MNEIEVDTLLPNDEVKDAVRNGDVSQIHRGKAYAEEGDRFELDGATFEITAVEERTLGDLTDEDAQTEGSPDLDRYKRRLDSAHAEGFEWNDDADVVRHAFERVE